MNDKNHEIKPQLQDFLLYDFLLKVYSCCITHEQILVFYLDIMIEIKYG